MLIGCAISFIAFGGIAYFVSKLCLNLGLDKDNKVLAALFYFLGPLAALSIISCVIVGIYSMMGLSMSVAAEAIATSMDLGSSGGLVIVGTILTAIFGIAAIAAGPATAFTASQFSSLVALIGLFAVRDEELCKKWLPWVAAAAYGFCMWPFAAILTFGL